VHRRNVGKFREKYHGRRAFACIFLILLVLCGSLIIPHSMEAYLQWPD
jgi:hypothetical protein